MKLSEMTAGDMILKMREGACTSEELVSSCLERIKSREEVVGAWVFLDEESSLSQSREADQRAKEGSASTLSLHGIPVGIKDIFDTGDMPTENGTAACRGRQPTEDAAVIRRLRKAGAIIMGKTVTAELAVYIPGKTTNPHDASRTPGGSSSGSAAAVAAKMIPLAIGTQTNGSIIRPASYCGVVGYKPTFGTIPRTGILRQAPSLDQVGVFAGTVRDSALLASVLMGREEQHSDTLPWPKLDFAQLVQNYDSPPRIAFVKTPAWSESCSSAKEAFLTYLQNLDVDIVEIDLPEICGEAVACHRTIMLCEMAYNYNYFLSEHRDQISVTLLGMLEEGRGIPVSEYLCAKNLSIDITSTVDFILKDCNAVLTPATPSEAPEGLNTTGSPIFSTIWSLCGVPAVSLPVLKGASGMPLGLQLVGARGRDTDVLRVAQWLETKNKSTIGRQGEE